MIALSKNRDILDEIYDIEHTESIIEPINESVREKKIKAKGFFWVVKEVINEHFPTRGNKRKWLKDVRDVVQNRYAQELGDLREEVRELKEGKDDFGFGPGRDVSDLVRYEKIVDRMFHESDNTVVAKAVTDVCESFGFKADDLKDKKEVIEAFRSAFSGLLGFSGGMAAFGFTNSQIIAAQNACWLRWKLDPHIFSMIENFVSYVIGPGVKFKCAVPEVQEFLETDYWQFNDMELHHKERFRQRYIRGEQLPSYRKLKSGKLLILDIPTEQISEVSVVDDKFTVAYHRKASTDDGKSIDEWYPDVFLDDLKEEKEIKVPDDLINKLEGNDPVFHMKFGNEPRGYPPMTRTLRYAKYYEDFIKEVKRLYGKQAEIILVKKFPMGDVRSLQSEKMTHPATRGGKVLRAIKDHVEYDFISPDVNAGSVDKIGRLLRLSLSAGGQTPEIIAFFDAGDMVYAAVRESSSPYHNRVIDLQDSEKELLNIEAKFIFIRHAVETRRLPEKVSIAKFDDGNMAEASVVLQEALVKMHQKADSVDVDEVMEQIKTVLGKPKKTEEIRTINVVIEWEFRELSSVDPLKLAQSLKIYWEMGVSEETLYGKAGFDPNVEIARRLKQRQRELELRQQERTLLTQGRDAELEGFGDSELGLDEE